MFQKLAAVSFWSFRDGVEIFFNYSELVSWLEIVHRSRGAVNIDVSARKGEMLTSFLALTEELQRLHSLLDLQSNPICVAPMPERSCHEEDGRNTS